MKISKQTIEQLKALYVINPSIVIKPTNVLTTVANSKMILASVKIDEEFPQEFGIYDLGSFLNMISLFEDPEITFEGSTIKFNENDNSATYFTTDVDILSSTEKTSLELPTVQVDFNMSSDLYEKIMTGVSKTGLPQIKFSNDNGNIICSLTDYKNKTSNNFSMIVQPYLGEDDFEIYINIENMKIIPGEYNVKFHIGDLAISEWKNANDLNMYWIALEPNSKIGE